MMRARHAKVLFALVVLALGAACDALPGKPRPGDEPVASDRVTDFDALFASNCAACHGAAGKGAAACPLNDPIYLELVDDDTVRDIAANGVPGTPMPAFAREAGGSLTTEQIGVLVTGIRRWAGATRPAASASLLTDASVAGDPQRGAQTFVANCARCHGADGTGGPFAGSVLDRAYLGLTSDRGLRTTIAAGRPDLGMPNWRTYVAGREMTPGEIADVATWISTHRSGSQQSVAVQRDRRDDR